MTVVELAVTAVIMLWAFVGHRRADVGLGLAGVGAVAVLLLAIGDRWRWQLVPLAVVAGIAVVLSIARSSDRAPVDLAQRTATVVVAVGAVLTLLAGVLLPVPTFALAEGSDPVGTVAFDLVDPSRRSPSTTVPEDAPRRITVQAWWPAGDATGEALALTEDGPALASAAGGFLGLPPVVLSHLDTIRTAATVGSPPATDGALPVIVSLHGWGGFRFAQAPLLEQLAADGHLVLAVDHTHGAVAAQPVDGDVVPIDEALLPDDVPPAVYDEASTVLEDTFRADAVTLLTALRDDDPAVPPTVAALADLDRMLVMGHSTGGGAAVWLCAQEPACDGLITWDPWVEPLPPAVRERPPTVPWLSVLSQDWIGNGNDRVLRPLVALSPTATVVAIEGTAHRDVTVQPLLSPLASVLGLTGDLDKERVDVAALELSRHFVEQVLDPTAGDALVPDVLPADVIRP